MLPERVEWSFNYNYVRARKGKHCARQPERSNVPELPEVETIRRQLAPELEGRQIERVQVLDPLLVEPWNPDHFSRKLRRRRITSLRRRGKYLLFDLAGGDTLVIHLRMSGVLTRLDHKPAGDGRQYLRLVVSIEDGSFLSLRDPRRFGRAFLLEGEAATSYWEKLGPEPLERSFNRKVLKAIVTGRSRPVKSTLMDQHLVAGIGNIYADEALFGARIHPEKPAGDLSDEEIKNLTISIKETLRRAIRLQGSSIDSYRDSRGERGSFQETFKVHRREGQPCPGCGGTVKKIKVGGRGTYFCPRCQKKN